MRYNLLGGALIDFHLHEHGVNPLSFDLAHTSDNGKKIRYQGHFICLGRWGDPSEQETKRGIIKHGDIIMQQWDDEAEGQELFMQAASGSEGLHIHRKIKLDANSSCYTVTEKITNIHALGRLYNVVQHPTLEYPFYSDDTIVNCNADIASGKVFEDCVFPFIVNREDAFGWITAYSPMHQLMIGYIWKRSDYPWINHWIHKENNQPKYRGLEFGTTGIHLPFKDIISEHQLQVMGEQTCAYIDAGETQERSFAGFLLQLPHPFAGVEQINLEDDSIKVMEKYNSKPHIISHHLNIHELLK